MKIGLVCVPLTDIVNVPRRCLARRRYGRPVAAGRCFRRGPWQAAEIAGQRSGQLGRVGHHDRAQDRRQL